MRLHQLRDCNLRALSGERGSSATLDRVRAFGVHCVFTGTTRGEQPAGRQRIESLNLDCIAVIWGAGVSATGLSRHRPPQPDPQLPLPHAALPSSPRIGIWVVAVDVALTVVFTGLGEAPPSLLPKNSHS
jgi:hypothetical protein